MEKKMRESDMLNEAFAFCVLGIGMMVIAMHSAPNFYRIPLLFTGVGVSLRWYVRLHVLTKNNVTRIK